MKNRFVVVIVSVLVLIGLVCGLGIGPYTSASAARDLREALAVVHGEPYTGRIVEGGTESMEFTVEPNSFFLTNWTLRSLFGWDYRYNCTVIYTTSANGETVSVRTVTYQGIDPMDNGEETQRAYLDLESMQEQTIRH